MRQIMRWLLLAVLCVSCPIMVQAAPIFSEDYEVPLGDIVAGPFQGFWDATTPGLSPVNDALIARGWGGQEDCTGYCTMTIVTAPAGRTGKVLRMRYVGQFNGASPHIGKIYRTSGSNAEIWERYYVMYEPNDPLQSWSFTGGDAITSKQHYFNNTFLPNFVTDFSVNTPANELYVALQTASVSSNLIANLGIHTLMNQAGRWWCIETHASPSVVEMYIDSQRVIAYSSPPWVAPSAWTDYQVYRQGGNNLNRYEDDWVVSTTRIGCGIDTTAPAAPTGVTVTIIAMAMILGGLLYGYFTPNRVPPDRLLLGDHTADSATLRTVAVHGSQEGGEPVYVVAQANWTDGPRTPVSSADPDAVASPVETKDAD